MVVWKLNFFTNVLVPISAQLTLEKATALRNMGSTEVVCFGNQLYHERQKFTFYDFYCSTQNLRRMRHTRTGRTEKHQLYLVNFTLPPTRKLDFQF